MAGSGFQDRDGERLHFKGLLQLFPHRLQHRKGVGIIRQICPFVRIGGMVVKLFFTIAAPDIAPLLCTEAEMLIRGPGGCISLPCRRITRTWAMSISMF